jgi:O-antigen/teichoic acid export membrane protein
MVKSDIRLKYSGLIVFVSYLISVATGLAFVLMITRNVSTEEFGIWGNINDLRNYFILLSGIVPFWATRFIAREHAGSAKTGLIANIFISVAAASIYLLLVPIILPVLQISSMYTILYIIVSAEILELHIMSALEAVLRAKQPQTIGYALLIFEVCKVLLGFMFILQLELGLQGALYSIIISYAIKIAFYMKLTEKELKESAKWSHLKEWLKAAPINIYNIVGNNIANFTLILLFVYGGQLARGYYAAATTFISIISYSSLLAFALYPRLLSGGSNEDVSISLRFVMMFAIPMTIGVMVLSDSYLTVLEVAYAEARPVLLLLAISGLCITLSQVFQTVVLGTEKVDAKAKIAFRELVKTRLFLLFTLPYILSAVTLPAAFYVLTSVATTPLEAATYLALIISLAGSAGLIATYIIASKCLIFNFPWKSVFKYSLASAVMATVLLLIPHSTRLSRTVAFTLLGAAIYLTVLMLIDKKTRLLVKSILEEAMRIIKIRNPKQAK